MIKNFSLTSIALIHFRKTLDTVASLIPNLKARSALFAWNLSFINTMVKYAKLSSLDKELREMALETKLKTAIKTVNVLSPV